MFFFLDAAASDDEQVQCEGIASIVCPSLEKDIVTTTPRSNAVPLSSEYLFELGRFIAFAAPVKVVSLHFAYFSQSILLSAVAQCLASIANNIQGRLAVIPLEICK